MNIHPEVTQLNGIVSVSIIAEFIGADTDATDQQRILAYGDPKVNLAGLFTDPNNNAFSFRFPASELYVGVTTQMSAKTARFMTALPAPPRWQGGAPAWPGQPWGNGQQMPYQIEQGVLDCLTTNPIEAATVWAAAIQTAVEAAMTTLRALTPAQLTSLPDATI